MPEPKILLFDIETAPILVYNWGLFMETTDPKFIRRDWFILCWAARWLGEKKMYFSSLPKFRGYKELPSKTEPSIDKEVVKELWGLLNEADIVIAHNLKGFDRKKANTRFIINGMKPPKPYEMIDTLQVSKAEFLFTSNRLGYVSDVLNAEKKIDSGGINTWLGCEKGDRKSWAHMEKYCKKDVVSLDDVYLRLRPFMRNHPSVNVYNEGNGCTNCGSESIIKYGFSHRAGKVFQRFRCNACGSPFMVEKKHGIVKAST